MIQDDTIGEIREPKLAGHAVQEACDRLRRRRTEAPALKTARKHCDMDCAPDGNHAKARKPMAFGQGPFRSEMIGIAERSPDAHTSSVYDALVERFAEDGGYEALPGNGRTLRNFIRRLEDDGGIAPAGEREREHDAVDVPPPGEKAQVDFGQRKRGGGPVARFIVVALRFSRLVSVLAQDRKSSAEEACRALRRFPCKCGGRVKALATDQGGAFVNEEAYGEVLGTDVLEASPAEQETPPWACDKAGLASKGLVENAAGSVESSCFSARGSACMDDAAQSPPKRAERKSRRMHQGTYRVPPRMLEDEIGRAHV